jgi:hypothetical protein
VENYLNARTATVTKGDHQPNMTEPDQMPTNNILLHEGVYFIQDVWPQRWLVSTT